MPSALFARCSARSSFVASLLLLAVPWRTPIAAPLSEPPAPAFVVAGGTTVPVATGTRVWLDCDLRNSGAFAPAWGSSVVLGGFGAPRLVGVSTFADLTLALHGTAALGNDATVEGLLTLGTGRLSLAGHDLNANAVTGGSAASYVVTPDTLGRLVRTVGSGAPTTFPVGNSGYDPLSVRTGAGSDVFRVAVLDAPPTVGLDPSTALTRAWVVSHANAAGVNGPLTYSVQWNLGESGAAFDRSLTNGAWAFRWLAGAWSPQSAVRRSDNGGWPAVDTLVTPDAGLWTLAGVAQLVDAGPPVDAPGSLELAPPAPNPFRRAATVRYGLQRTAHVRLTLHSVLGERVATLVDARQEAGWHVLRLDELPLASGVYFLRLLSGTEVRTRKLVVMR